MDDPDISQAQSPETKNSLPDVVHSQRSLPTDSLPTNEFPLIKVDTHFVGEGVSGQDRKCQDLSDTESISEHVPSNIDYSLSENDNKHLNINVDNEKTDSSFNLPNLPLIQNEKPSETSLCIEDPKIEVTDLRYESPLPLMLSSDISKDANTLESPSQPEEPIETPRSKFSDSLSNENVSHQESETNKQPIASDIIENTSEIDSIDNSGSEEIIKLDIRGQGAPKFPISTSQIIFGIPPDGGKMIEPNLDSTNLFTNLLSPILVKAENSVQIEEIFDFDTTPKEPSSLASNKLEQSDLLVEEMTIQDCMEKQSEYLEEDLASSRTQPKSIAPEETVSFSTFTTDYKTICEEYFEKLVHLEDSVTQRNQAIEELTVSLQKTKIERDQLQEENQHLLNEVQSLQHRVSDGVDVNISDLAKYESMVKEDTKFYSAIMSSGSSLSSKGDQRDNVHEEITVNYSRSDIRTSENSDDFNNGLENKIAEVVGLFDEFIEENRKNELIDKLMQVFRNEIERLRLENDAEVKQLEQEIQGRKVEVRQLRELLSSVQTGDVNVEDMRKQLLIQHQKEMENLRTYFEKQCSEMERSYSEGVLRERACSEAEGAGGAGDADHARGRQIMDQTSLNQMVQKYEEKIFSLCRHIALLEKRVRSSCEACDRPQGVSETDGQLYQQDIDLELEKNQQLFKETIVRELLVLLSDPDADLSSWPSELAAVRDIMQSDPNKHTSYSSLRDEDERHSLGGDTKCDKWRQRRHMTFDLNRQLGEVTKERDELQVLANDSQQALSLFLSYLVDAEPISKPTQSPDMTLNDSCMMNQSAVLRQDLHSSLLRLRAESHKLLQMTQELKKDKMADEGGKQIAELVEKIELNTVCNNCHTLKKSLEALMKESMERESLLKSDLEIAKMKIAELLTVDDTTDVIAEGYGSAVSPRPSSLPPSPRLQSELDAALKEKDDLLQQLESVKRTLRSTKQFVEEQAAERETERDEFAATSDRLREDNKRLATRLQNTARIMAEIQRLRPSSGPPPHVEQLETQAKEMTQQINELANHKTVADKQLKAYEQEISGLKKEVAHLEQQLENMIQQKNSHEKDIMVQLEEMTRTIDDRDSKIRGLLGELEAMRSDKDGTMCQRCDSSKLFEDEVDDDFKNYKEQMSKLERWINDRCSKLERVHEECSNSCSEATEDVSIKDAQQMGCGGRLWERVGALSRAEDATVKRVRDLEMQRAQLHDIAQELRSERDVLQARMSSQALHVSTLSARLDHTRAAAAADTARATADLSVRLCDATAQVERLQEELDTKEKQLSRLKRNVLERESSADKCDSPSEPKDKNVNLERKLAAAQSRIAQLETLTRTLETDNEHFQKSIREHQRLLAEKETQLQELIELKLEDENQEKSEIVEGKHSARTLSDIVSISDYDEQDLQMRRAEQKHNQSILPTYHEFNKSANATLPPSTRHKVRSLMEHLPENTSQPSPRPDSLPINLTSTVNKPKNFKRNINEMTILGTFDKYTDSIKHSTAANLHDNVSMYPNRDVSDDKEVSVEPRRIDFSLQPSDDNRTHDDITRTPPAGKLSDIVQQLKSEINNYRLQLEACKSELKQAEEQLCEFPALKEEVEKLKTILENTVETMTTDKKFYENQLESFTSNKRLLEQRITELTKDVNEKSKDLHLVKEDILSRENMILELAKEKRNLTNKYTELELNIDELQSRNDTLAKYESETNQLKEKMTDYRKLELLLSEKDQQIDSLNQHLDRLDELQRCLNEKTEEFDNLNDAFEEKSNEIFQLQATVNALNKDLGNANDENNKLIINNKDLKLKLTKLEKEQDNYSLRHQSSETEIARLNAINKELSMKLEELKTMTDKLKDKEYEIEILNEDINSFHLEIDSLKEQLKMASRSPSPRKSGDEKKDEGRLGGDKRQLVKIKKQISLLQHELDFNKKELNDKAYELAKTKLDLTELKNSFGHQSKCVADKDAAIAGLLHERDALKQQLAECEKERDSLLQAQADRVPECVGVTSVRSTGRSPTAELEQALQTQLDYSNRLNQDILQILSSSSDSEEIPPLNLHTSNSRSSSSVQSSSSERVQRLRSQNERLRDQLRTNDDRLRDKDALIAELYRVRDTLSGELDAVRYKYETERDNCARLQLLLDTHKETADSLQSQDTNMIGILKQRLECCMRSELDLQHQLRDLRQKSLAMETQLVGRGGDAMQEQLQQSLEDVRTENRTLRSKLELERNRYVELTAKQQRDENKLQLQITNISDNLQTHRTRLAEALRQKQEISAELSRNKQLVQAQTATLRQLQAATGHDVMSELECHRVELSRDIASLRQCLDVSRLHLEGHDKDYAVRYLHSRCVRLESCRKALVWQKRYLQHIAAACAPARWHAPLSGKRRFKSIALVVVVMCRMSYLVRRRNSARHLARALATPAPCTGTSPPSRDVPAPHRVVPVSSRAAPAPATPQFRLLLPHSPAPLLDEVFRRATPRASRVSRPQCLISAVTSPRTNDTPLPYIPSTPH